MVKCRREEIEWQQSLDCFNCVLKQKISLLTLQECKLFAFLYFYIESGHTRFQIISSSRQITNRNNKPWAAEYSASKHMRDIIYDCNYQEWLTDWSLPSHSSLTHNWENKSQFTKKIIRTRTTVAKVIMWLCCCKTYNASFPAYLGITCYSSRHLVTFCHAVLSKDGRKESPCYLSLVFCAQFKWEVNIQFFVIKKYLWRNLAWILDF